jgi:hypothetical protein
MTKFVALVSTAVATRGKATKFEEANASGDAGTRGFRDSNVRSIHMPRPTHAAVANICRITPRQRI